MPYGLLQAMLLFCRVGPLLVGRELAAKLPPLAPDKPATLPHLVFKGLVSTTPTTYVCLRWGDLVC